MITWSSKSRRQLPTQRSATPFCHGQPKAVRVGWLPMSLTAETTSAPNFASRSNSKALAGTTSTKLCRLLGGNAQVFHEREHVLADGLVVFIDGRPAHCRLTTDKVLSMLFPQVPCYSTATQS